jgi:hypothetical protein
MLSPGSVSWKTAGRADPAARATTMPEEETRARSSSLSQAAHLYSPGEGEGSSPSRHDMLAAASPGDIA